MIKKLKELSLATFVSLTTGGTAMAQLTGPSTPANLGRFGNLSQAIDTIFGFVITIAGIFFVILFLVGGIQYLTSAGEPEGTKKAKQLLVDAIIGLIIVLAAWAIGQFILKTLGLNVSTA